MQINVVRKENARARAEKITACNYEPEETTSKGKHKELHRPLFPPGDVMKNKINFQLLFSLPAYMSNGETQD